MYFADDAIAYQTTIRDCPRIGCDRAAISGLSRAVLDAAHVAVAAIHGLDYLVTWNCRHLANAQIMRRISQACERMGQRMPIICTPEELMGE